MTRYQGLLLTLIHIPVISCLPRIPNLPHKHHNPSHFSWSKAVLKEDTQAFQNNAISVSPLYSVPTVSSSVGVSTDAFTAPSWSPLSTVEPTTIVSSEASVATSDAFSYTPTTSSKTDSTSQLVSTSSESFSPINTWTSSSTQKPSSSSWPSSSTASATPSSSTTTWTSFNTEKPSSSSQSSSSTVSATPSSSTTTWTSLSTEKPSSSSQSSSSSVFETTSSSATLSTQLTSRIEKTQTKVTVTTSPSVTSSTSLSFDTSLSSVSSSEHVGTKEHTARTSESRYWPISSKPAIYSSKSHSSDSLTTTKSKSTTMTMVTSTKTKCKSSSASTLTTTQTTTTSTVVTSHTRKRKHRKHKTRSQTTNVPPTETTSSTTPGLPALNPTVTYSLAPSSTISLTLATTLTISEVQTLTTTTTVPPDTTGSINTELSTAGQNTLGPFSTTVIPPPSQSVKPITKGPHKISSATTMAPTVPLANNIFVPIATGAPVSQITPRGGQPVPPIGIKGNKPFDTNKFYANFYLGGRTQSSWTHPYSVAWVQGGGGTGSWGLSVLQVPESQTVFGEGSPPTYYTNPLGIQPIILSARELGGSTDLSMDDLEQFSCNVYLSPATGATPIVTFPLVQGMGFVTAVYNGGTPFIQSGVYFQSLMYTGNTGKSARYVAILTTGETWLIYITASSGSVPTLTLSDSSEIIGSQQFFGSVQVAKVPDGKSVGAVQGIYDASAGVYPIKGNIQASVKGKSGTYQFSWTKGGLTSKPLLMFALPHHVQSFSKDFKASFLKGALKLDTTTKGIATAVQTDSWQLIHHDIPSEIGFAPWSAKYGSRTAVSQSAIDLIQSVAASELNEDFATQTNLDSMYYSGKAFAKFASAIYAANDVGKDPGIASAGLMKLKASFATFVNNQQITPLNYDTVWGGVISSCIYTTGDFGCDFGNGIYNDHHFHYGYFVYTAAVIGYLDPSWLNEGTNKAWVNTLVRDYANPVSDRYFPFQRMFDWWHGHSWAHGLSEVADGKDQESSSEDAFSSYAIKMWGRTIGDPNMEARGNLQLAVQARSLSDYYLMQDDNKVEPSIYLPNKASGILFENKIDHTTYFGTQIEFIEGIHMIPLNPSSAFTRSPTFVSQEWNTYFSDGRVDAIDNGWKGILYANLAIIDPVTSYNFFAQPNFDPTWLDGGASRTWYLAYAAGLGGALA